MSVSPVWSAASSTAERGSITVQAGCGARTPCSTTSWSMPTGGATTGSCTASGSSSRDCEPATTRSAPVQVLDEAARLLSERYDVDFDSVGLNLYRDGRDSVAWHGDRIPRDLPEPLVATLTLGAQRRFLLRPKGGGRVRALRAGIRRPHRHGWHLATDLAALRAEGGDRRSSDQRDVPALGARCRVPHPFLTDHPSRPRSSGSPVDRELLGGVVGVPPSTDQNFGEREVRRPSRSVAERGMTWVPISSIVCMTSSWRILYGFTRHSSRSTPAAS